MDQSKKSIIRQKINFLHKKKLVKNWPFDLMNAELAIRYAWCSDTTFDLLKKVIFKNELCLHKTVDHENSEIRNQLGITISDVEIWHFYKSNLTDVEYFNTLAITKWEYSEFIISAWVFCLEKNLMSENSLEIFVSISAQYFARIFLYKTSLSTNIFSCILELKLFDFFSSVAAKGFIKFLEPEISIKGRLQEISKFLYVFSFFPVCFIKQCQMDCMMLQNLAPLKLALYVLCVNSQNSEKEKFFASKELEYFKKELVDLKLVNSEFVHKCNASYFKDKQKKIPFKNYYSYFD